MLNTNQALRSFTVAANDLAQNREAFNTAKELDIDAIQSEIIPKEIACSIKRLADHYEDILDELAFMRGFVKERANSLQLEPLPKVLIGLCKLVKVVNSEQIGVCFVIDDLTDESVDFDLEPIREHEQRRRQEEAA